LYLAQAREWRSGLRSATVRRVRSARPASESDSPALSLVVVDSESGVGWRDDDDRYTHKLLAVPLEGQEHHGLEGRAGDVVGLARAAAALGEDGRADLHLALDGNN